jgi:DNA-binding IclR family transcriptional regulator
MGTDQRGYRIGASERALLIMDTLAEMPDCSLVDLAGRLGLPKGSVFRHLRVLEERGYVTQAGDTKRYALGPRLIYLGFVARAGLALPRVAAPFLRELHERFNETVHVGVLSAGEVVHIEVVPSSHPVKMAAEVGARTFAHISALGKVLLAGSEDEVIARVIEERGLPRFTERTITTAAALQAELDRVRRYGFAIDDEESAEGLRCVACPIRGEGDRVIAAVSLSSPAQRLSPGEARDVATVLASSAEQISRGVGWHPPTTRDASSVWPSVEIANTA